jgi:prepilin-type N-terminal cleavage/methylation domain-containing protein
MFKGLQKKRGFTLIEILFVVVVIAILAAIAIPRIVTSTATAKTNACLANQAIMNTQIEQYRLDTGDWPDALTDVTNNTTYFPDGAPACPEGTFANYSMNGTTHRVSCNTDGH